MESTAITTRELKEGRPLLGCHFWLSAVAEREKSDCAFTRYPPPREAAIFFAAGNSCHGRHNCLIRYNADAPCFVANAQYTSTSTAASRADFTTSSNLRSAVFGALSFDETSGTDSRKLNSKLLLTA